MPILTSRDNPMGWKLEDLARQVRDELSEKNKDLRTKLMEPMPVEQSDVMLDVIHNNQHIITGLNNIVYLQQHTRQRISTLGKDLGPFTMESCDYHLNMVKSLQLSEKP